MRRPGWLFLFLACAWAGTAIYHSFKPLPPGTNIRTRELELQEQDVRFLHDLTVGDGRGRRIIHQEIFDAVFELIDRARELVVLDFFLLNDDRGALAAEGRRTVHSRKSSSID